MKANAVILILLIAAMGLVAAAFLVLRDHSASQQLPILAQGRPFTLSDQRGVEFSSSRLLGKAWIASFFFTSCEGICPTINGSIARFAQKVRGDSQVQFVSVSVDPERDTPAVLAEYAARFKADPSYWHFLTGQKSMVNGMLENFKLGSAEDPMQHTGRLVLLDGESRVRGYYQGTDEHDFEMLERDLRLLERGR